VRRGLVKREKIKGSAQARQVENSILISDLAAVATHSEDFND